MKMLDSKSSGSKVNVTEVVNDHNYTSPNHFPSPKCDQNLKSKDIVRKSSPQNRIERKHNTPICAPVEESTGHINVPVQSRLPIHRKTSVDKLRDKFKHPEDAVPKNSLPTWKQLPLTKKLPLVPAPPGAIWFSRGNVAKPLVRSTQTFCLNDPFGMERLPTTEYNALHDVHTLSYFEKPFVRQLLIQQNLINCDNQVVCSQKEFNQFRNYLAAIQNEKLNGVIGNQDQKWLTDRAQMLKLLKYQSMQVASGRDYNRWLKTRNAARKNQIKQANLIRRTQEQRDAEKGRVRRIEGEKQREIIQKKLSSLEKERVAAQRRQRKIEWELQSRQKIITNIKIKDAAIQNRVQEDTQFLKRAYNQFLLEWLEAKYKYQKEHNPQVEAIEKSLESNLKHGANERQEKAERNRRRLPEIAERNKKRERYLWEIMKKYFYRWLNKVRERKDRKADAQHQSLWDTVTVMDGTLKYLKEESGYETLGTFIFNILKFKEDIKVRLAEEEEAERKAQENSIERQEGSTSLSGKTHFESEFNK